MSSIFHTILYQPLFNGLVYFYTTIAFNDLGVAIIVLTIVIRILLFPLFYKGFKNQTIMQRIQPEIKRLQETHKHDKEKMATAMMEVYERHHVNPFSSILLILLQLPILIALYQVFLNGFGDQALTDLYPFVQNPGHLNATLFHLIDLKGKSILLVILAAVCQYYQGVLSLGVRKGDEQKEPHQQMAKTMVWIGPILTVVVLGALPAAVGLYWFISSLFSIGQQWYINKSIDDHGETTSNHKTTISADGV
jgi:YidC/Oxa1 family membrane protein insertase